MDVFSGFNLQGYMKAKRKGEGLRLISPFVVLQIFIVSSTFYLKCRCLSSHKKCMFQNMF